MQECPRSISVAALPRCAFAPLPLHSSAASRSEVWRRPSELVQREAAFARGRLVIPSFRPPSIPCFPFAVANLNPETWLLLQSGSRPAAENMAMDEVLLETAPVWDQPVLRFYDWREAAATFGYSQKYAEIAR